MNNAPHTHTVAPVWRAERGQPLGGGCARPAGLGVLRSAAHRRAEFRLPVWLRGVYFIIAVHHAFVLGLGARHGGIVKLSVVRCVTVFACFTLLLGNTRRTPHHGRVRPSSVLVSVPCFSLGFPGAGHSGVFCFRYNKRFDKRTRLEMLSMLQALLLAGAEPSSQISDQERLAKPAPKNRQPFLSPPP
jgi:hypothetical protein